MYIASGGVEPLQRFAVDSFIMLMSDRVRTISGPAKIHIIPDLVGIGVKVQPNLFFSASNSASLRSNCDSDSCLIRFFA